MKKLFTLFFSLLLAGLFTTASAQQNIFVWKKGGDLSVISSESVDSVSFSAGSWLFHITTSAAVSVTTNSFQARSSVSLNENVKSLSVTPEVGVCYSDKNPQPTYVDGKQSSDANMEDNIFIVEGLVSGTLYYYRTYVKLLDEVYYDQNVYTVTTRGAKPQGKIIGGHKFIDLGLPSGLLWAETNVGASSYFDDGDYLLGVRQRRSLLILGILTSGKVPVVLFLSTIQKMVRLLLMPRMMLPLSSGARVVVCLLVQSFKSFMTNVIGLGSLIIKGQV